MRIRNIIFGAGTFAVMLGILLLVWLLPYFVPVPPAAQYAPGPTPESFPRILAWTLLSIGALVLMLDIVTKPEERGPSEFVFKLATLSFILLSSALYVIGFQLVGFNITTFFFLCAYFCFFSPLGLLRSSLLSLAVTVAIALLFGALLKIPLPSLIDAF